MGADVVDGEDVGVIERGDGARLLLEAAQPVRIGREPRGQDLDRDVAPEPRVAGAVHLAHPARADRGDDLGRDPDDSPPEPWEAAGRLAGLS